MDERIRNLTIEERIRLVEDIWDSIADDQAELPLTEAQRLELHERLNAYRVSGSRGRPARDAIEDVRRRL